MPRRTLGIFFIVGLLLLSGGCVRRVPVTFDVTDADTRKPIGSAYVRAVTVTADFDQDLAMSATGQTAHVEGRTGSDGRVTLDVPSGRLPIHVSVRADGYMSGSTGFGPRWARSPSASPVVREVALYPIPPGQAVGGRVVNAGVKAVVVLPDGFRGPLRVVSRGRAEYVAGKRAYEVPAEVDGITAIPSVPPVLSGGSSVARRLEARFAGGGNVLPKQEHFSPGVAGRAATPPDVVGFRLVAMNDIRSLFVVGTAGDADEFRSRNGLNMTDPGWAAAFDRIFPKSAAAE